MLSIYLSMILVHLAALLFITAFWKLTRIKSFIKLTVAYHVLPAFLSRIVGFMIPFLEVLSGFLLLYVGTAKYGAILFIILLACFAYAVIRVLKENRKISCGCYGQGMESEADAFTLGKIIYLIMLSLFVVITDQVHIQDVSVLSLFFGMLLTIVLLLTQKVWTLHRHAVAQLRK